MSTRTLHVEPTTDPDDGSEYGILDQEGTELAVVYGGKQLAQEFAAAPDLLAACIAQHDIIDRLMAMLIMKEPGFMPTQSVAWPVCLQANAAIAKAEGRA